MDPLAQEVVRLLFLVNMFDIRVYQSTVLTTKCHNTAETGQTKVGTFKLLHPGLFIYHCAAAPVPMHVNAGMYGLLLVEPAQVHPIIDSTCFRHETLTKPINAGSSSR